MNTNSLFQKAQLLLLILSAGFFFSCSTDTDSEIDSLEVYDFKVEKATTPEAQVEMLTKAMRRFHNFDVAIDQGYIQVSELVPGMGYHFAKPEYVDMQFDLLKPEILVYHPDDNGKMQFVAAEYLIPIPGCDDSLEYSDAPEGFIGDEDHWHVNCLAGGWTLHAWVGLENPNGVFAAFNPLLNN